MDYQLFVYPSEEKDLLNFKSDNSSKQIKVLCENKLSALYKKSFNSAVKKFNERATSGRLIENYYQSIVESNIPEVYKVVLSIRYDLANKEEPSIAQRLLLEFKKALEKENYFNLVSSYMLSYDEFKEIQIFFFPLAANYSTGLSMRADFIDALRKKHDIQDNLNIAQAIELCVDDYECIFDKLNKYDILSQKELEEKTLAYKKEDPFYMHAIATNTLKKQVELLKKININNQQLEYMVEKEKERINNDLQYIIDTSPKILQAEKDRIWEEERRRQEELRELERAKLREAELKELERLKEEERKIEAQRLAELVSANMELRRELTNGIVTPSTKEQYSQEDIDELIRRHEEWQDEYNIGRMVDLDHIPPHAMQDGRRLCLKGANIRDISLVQVIIGATLENCCFSNCELKMTLIGATINNCMILNSKVKGLAIIRSNVNGLKCQRAILNQLYLEDTTFRKVNFNHSSLMQLFSSPANSFIKCDFNHALFENCDMKNNAFMNCNFNGATFKKCDIRNSTFQVCNTSDIIKEHSIFKGATFKHNE